MAGGIAMSVSPESGGKKAAQCCHIAPDEGVAWVEGGWGTVRWASKCMALSLLIQLAKRSSPSGKCQT